MTTNFTKSDSSSILSLDGRGQRSPASSMSEMKRNICRIKVRSWEHGEMAEGQRSVVGRRWSVSHQAMKGREANG